MKLSREVKTGILAVLAILLLIFGYNYLKGSNLFNESRVFYVKYDNVEGLSKAAPVTINGFQVGKVQEIGFADKSGGLVVAFTVDKEFEFSRNSLVQIYSSGLIGGNNLAIVPEYNPNNTAKSGDTLNGEIAQSLLDAVTGSLGPLERKVNGTLATVDSFLININTVLDDETKENLKSAIANLNVTARNFGSASRKLDGLLANNSEKLDNTFTNLDITASNFAKLSDSLAQIETGQMVRDLEAVTSKLNSIVSDVENGNGSIGKLLKDEQLYDNLEGATRQMEQLIQDIKLNPKRYVHLSVFGRKAKEYEPPADPDQ